MRWGLILCSAACAVISGYLLLNGRTAEFDALGADASAQLSAAQSAANITQRQLQMAGAVHPENDFTAASDAAFRQLAVSKADAGSDATNALIAQMERQMLSLSRLEQQRKDRRLTLERTLDEITARYSKLASVLREAQSAALSELDQSLNSVFQTWNDISGQTEAETRLRRAIGTFVKDQTHAAEQEPGNIANTPRMLARIRQLEWTVANLIDDAVAQQHTAREKLAETRQAYLADIQRQLTDLHFLTELRLQTEALLKASERQVKPDTDLLKTGQQKLLETHERNPVFADVIQPIASHLSELIDAAAEDAQTLDDLNTQRREIVDALARSNQDLLTAVESSRQTALATLANRIAETITETAKASVWLMAMTALSLTMLVLSSKRQAPAGNAVPMLEVRSQSVEQALVEPRHLSREAESTKAAKKYAGNLEKDDRLDTVRIELDGLQDRLDGLAEHIDNLLRATEATDKKFGDGSSETPGLDTVRSEASKAVASLDDMNRQAVMLASLAEKSRYLAINASIEASRAREFGSGFAVVATEMQKLAERSKEASTRINGTINDARSSMSRLGQTLSDAIAEHGDSQSTHKEIRAAHSATEGSVHQIRKDIVEVAIELTRLRSELPVARADDMRRSA